MISETKKLLHLRRTGKIDDETLTEALNAHVVGIPITHILPDGANYAYKAMPTFVASRNNTRANSLLRAMQEAHKNELYESAREHCAKALVMLEKGQVEDPTAMCRWLLTLAMELNNTRRSLKQLAHIAKHSLQPNIKTKASALESQLEKEPHATPDVELERALDAQAEILQDQLEEELIKACKGEPPVFPDNVIALFDPAHKLS